MALMKKLLVLSALACASAIAQAPLGTVVNVNGVVTATQGATGATVVQGSPVVNGMRFVTTSNGRVTLRMNSGCVVNLAPGQALTVLQTMTCQELVAAVQTVQPVAAGSSFSPSPGLVNGVILAGAAGILIQILRHELDDDEPLSPN